jgi:hypothetical protein
MWREIKCFRIIFQAESENTRKKIRSTYCEVFQLTYLKDLQKRMKNLCYDRRSQVEFRTDPVEFESDKAALCPSLLTQLKLLYGEKNISGEGP